MNIRLFDKRCQFGLLIAALAEGIAWTWSGELSEVTLLLHAFAAMTLIVTVSRPKLLEQPLRWWLRIGDFLARLVSPVVLAMIFFGIITPMAIILRLTSVDRMGRKFAPSSKTYWRDKAEYEMQNTERLKRMF